MFFKKNFLRLKIQKETYLEYNQTIHKSMDTSELESLILGLQANFY